ncbi:MAG: hypothetical protein NC314_12470 [Roseburia sp.]|nr:hypothetical protein [Roseburia sp.]MCM1243649.1 hypothetical protein [Roseburia sp.]
MMKIVGYLKQEIIDSLKLKITTNTPIYLGNININHIKNKHPYEYECYFDYIEEIIDKPDYYGINPKDENIMLIKIFEVSGNNIRIGIKLTKEGKLYMKTLHMLNSVNFERFLEKGTIRRLTQNSD